jgi:hypothetical protein
VGPQRVQGRAGGHPGGDAVIDEDDRPSGERREGSAATVELHPPSELGPFRLDDGAQVAGAHPEPCHRRLVVDRVAALGHRTEAVLRLAWVTDLARDEDLGHRAELGRSVRRHHHTAARQPEDNRVG